MVFFPENPIRHWCNVCKMAEKNWANLFIGDTTPQPCFPPRINCVTSYTALLRPNNVKLKYLRIDGCDYLSFREIVAIGNLPPKTVTVVYTVIQKPPTILFIHNFGKYWPILNFSPLDSTINLQWNLCHVPHHAQVTLTAKLKMQLYLFPKQLSQKLTLKFIYFYLM